MRFVEKLFLRNEHYKWSIDPHRVYREFQEGDQVMVRLKPERSNLELLRNYIHVVQGHLKS